MTAASPDRSLRPGGAYVLVGPTATGKTSVTHDIALLSGAHVLSADSMAVYRGMHVGTAKPAADWLSQVPYWGLDLVHPSQGFSVSHYLAEAARAHQAAKDADVPLLVVGGTGLYIKCLTEGLRETPPANHALREHWDGRVKAEGIGPLVAAAREADPAQFDHLTESDRRNARRLIRFIERAEAEGSGAAAWGKGARVPQLLGLNMPIADLKDKIRLRCEGMFAGGLLDEARQLLDGGLDEASTAMQAIGYAEACACLRGELSRQDAIDRTVNRTWRLARKQLTWFRHQANVSWIEIDTSIPRDELAMQVMRRWVELGPVDLLLP